MSNDETPWQKSIEASRAFLARSQCGDDVVNSAIDAIAARRVEILSPPPELMDDGVSAETARNMENITRLGPGYKDLSRGMAWLVTELLASIERDTGVTPADTLARVETDLKRRTSE